MIKIHAEIVFLRLYGLFNVEDTKCHNSRLEVHEIFSFLNVYLYGVFHLLGGILGEIKQITGKLMCLRGNSSFLRGNSFFLRGN